MRSLPLVVLAVVAQTRAAVKELWWNITYVQDINPDGLQPRRVIGINGTWPPPPIEVTMNDTLVVHAINGIDQPTSLHHHGMYFNGTSWMDGAVGVTQCGIPPGFTYTYEVPINEAHQWGTYWVHAHAHGQYVDGLRAPFIIHRNEDFVTSPPSPSAGASPRIVSSNADMTTPEAYAYDEEFTVILGDWYHTEHSILIDRFISKANPGGAEPVPDSALIYFSQNGTYLTPAITSGSTPANIGFNENGTLPFVAGKTYRLRVINTSAFSMFFFWIEGHDMSIIEVDGTDIQPSPVDTLAVTVAQRYSVLVTARNDTDSAWIIHANMDTDMFDTVPDALQPNVTSSITYGKGGDSNHTTERQTVDDYPMVEDEQLVPLLVAPAPTPNRLINISFNFDTFTDGTNRAYINDITYNAPVVPPVFSEVSLGSWADSEDPNPYGPSTFVLHEGTVVEMTVFNNDAGKHPFHLHGHKFSIVNRVQDFTSSDPSLNPPLNTSFPNPMRRDTIEIPSMGSVTLRFDASNPGAWLFHCHIDWHLSAGLAVVFMENPLTMQNNVGPPQYAYDACAAQGTPTSGNAAGHDSLTDLSGLTVGPYLQNNGWHAKGIGAMAACVLSAVLGMAAVIWYAYGGQLSDEEMEEDVRRGVMEKEARGGKIQRMKGLVGKKN